jgi:hypothetical protein
MPEPIAQTDGQCPDVPPEKLHFQVTHLLNDCLSGTPISHDGYLQDKASQQKQRQD